MAHSVSYRRTAFACGASLVALTSALGEPRVALAQDGASERDVIVVTATRRAEDIRDVPASVTAESGEDLAELFEAGQDVLAMASRFPSLNVESSNGRVAPRFYIRGLGNTDFDLAASQPVSVIIDDVVMENVTLKSFPIFDVDQVEILRGPQGTLFGRNTTAGIVKFASRRPTDYVDGYGVVSYGELDSFNVEAAVGGPLVEDVLSGRVSLLSQNRGDWIDNAFTGESDALGGYEELAGRVQLLYTPTDNLSVLGNVHARSLDGTAAIFRANILTTGSNDLNGNFDRDRVFFDGGNNNPQSYDQWGASATVEYELEDYSLFSITAYETTEGSSRGDIDGGACAPLGTPVPDGLTSGMTDCFFPFDGTADAVTFPGFIPFASDTQDGIDTLDQWTQEFRIASDYGDRFEWQAGAYFFSSEFDITTQGPGFPPLTTLRHENDMWAVFGQASYDVNDVFTLSGGLRYTSDEKDLTGVVTAAPVAPVSVSDEQVSWDIAGLYDLSDDTSLYARVARGFRGPTIQGRDVAFGADPSTADSETSISYEAGVKTDLFGGATRLNASAFYYEVSDLQLTAVGGAGNLVQLVNADKGVGHGVEVEFESDLSDYLTVRGGFSWNDTELQDSALEVAPCGSGQCTPLDPDVDMDGFVEVDGNPFPQAPEYVLTFGARYGVPFRGGELFASTDWYYQGETSLLLYEAAEFNTDGNFEGALRLGYQGELAGGQDYEIALFARNITDEENLLGVIDFNNNTGFVNEPRVVGVSLSATFN